MVITTVGFELAKITVIDLDYNVVYDQYVLPENPIVDYNTKFSGITPELLSTGAKSLKEVQADILKLIDKTSILVGHSLENDLASLKIVHERVIDTSILYQNEGGFKSSLKNLSFKYLNWKIQNGDDGHDSAEDAKAALALAKYRIEVIDNIPILGGNEEEYTPLRKADFLENLIAQKNSVLLIERAKYLKAFLKFGIHITECSKSGSLEGITKGKSWISQSSKATSNVPNIILLREKYKENADFGSAKEYLTRLDQLLKEMNDLSTETVYGVFFIHRTKEESLQAQRGEHHRSSVSNFVSKFYTKSDACFLYASKT
eukprot:TRINITY_DN6668_c0_g1_i1.p1 TRINITY_DN6668_c0_g1~~TRINITY_DN6668_c0_g1_i1.p1  ORF type:complete len:317 (-),score=32.92 TRINITY_DN6668_c0_g1_i1:77-1027(-)